MSAKVWENHNLGYLLGNKGYIRGPFGSSLKRGDMKSDGIPVYEQQHAIYNSRDFRFYIDEEKFYELRRFQVKTNDLIVSCSGTIGKVSIISDKDPKGIISQALLILRPDNTKMLPEFLKYYFLSREGFNNLVSTSHGSVQVNIASRDIVESLTLNVPDIPTQRRIADILSSLDDKIELNRQTNATLEAIAQAIFKEWFVDFNFPGATGEMFESELGMIPKGWKVGSVADVVILANETISPGLNPDNLFNHYSIPAFDSGRVPSQELGSSILSNKFRVKNNSILVSKLNPRIPRIWTVKEVDQENSVCSTEFQVLIPKRAHYYSFAASLFSQPFVIDTMKSRASGTSGSHQRINPQDILDINFVIPPDNLLSQYDKIVGNYFQSKINGLEESMHLAKIRDSLLPKLMNGEIIV
ncbi:MAG TPA: hypothetical protein DCY35_10650 [Prolixibacteraceae bacterium]|jgi:type I restriction enzyme S subunit|nr:hypothetical protein [Prolixibacteraceae bacterium]